MSISIEEIRRILGSGAEGKTDEQLEQMRDGLEDVARDMYDHLVKQSQAVERLRWSGHAHENGIEDDREPEQ
jgi:hypothetical protein